MDLVHIANQGLKLNQSLQNLVFPQNRMGALYKYNILDLTQNILT
jgi:hypothetical protein